MLKKGIEVRHTRLNPKEKFPFLFFFLILLFASVHLLLLFDLYDLRIFVCLFVSLFSLNGFVS